MKHLPIPKSTDCIGLNMWLDLSDHSTETGQTARLVSNEIECYDALLKIVVKVTSKPVITPDSELE